MHVLKSFDMSSFDLSSSAKILLAKFLTIANIRFLPVDIALRHNIDVAFAVFPVPCSKYNETLADIHTGAS